MCGIALIVSGVRIDLLHLLPDFKSSLPEVEQVDQPVFSFDDIKAALLRRGPDNFGSKKVLLLLKSSDSSKKEEIISLFNADGTTNRENSCLHSSRIKNDCIPSTSGVTSVQSNDCILGKSVAELLFFGATLQLRGTNQVYQPLVDGYGNLLVYNGEIFGGIHVGSNNNDTAILMDALGRCFSCNCQGDKKACYCTKGGQNSVPELLSKIKGPWALIYWQDSSKTMWFGRDAFGRRSLLVHWPTADDSRFLLSSVSPPLSYKKNLGVNQCSDSLPAQRVLLALKESVKRRITLERMFQTTANEVRPEKFVPVAVLFSGGLDSMILAALLDECLDRTYEIDLLNVSFDGESAPDRISARAGVKELQRIAPSRRWNLVEIDADLSDLTSETLHVMSLINPAKTYMDLNIGIALWLAAGGHGWVDRGVSNNHNEGHGRSMYKSEAKILLVGSGADEQCAGYGRHKTKYRLGGWLGLHEEMKLDMHRIWKRNLGRDDRCISDNGKEARFPFLDEDVIRTLLDIPLCEVADLDQPIGRGDKKILREVAWLLGLKEAASLPKRAIQFGSRIARESNRKNFGSNRAANQASAGSLVIHMETKFT
ncbi:PREDICTED: asparagine synthetase domain-containing protein 1 isoform X4 [Nelumbo nucifera]|uniref:Asparagine synthetase domain-containing protein 1 isoform X4 n=1 Tax=Nelumbo nucifera TaxID=4432 RepID=A0A1U8Q3P0_NELNU|nr:PREDICTED: asparagine synthetase domain-containing protein 1 isoform X4 [Nelumbo nucifera]